MTEPRSSEWLFHHGTAMLLSLVLVSMSLIWQGDRGFNIWDEGFLWYGVQRVMVGEVPIRDFMAYDPGRYFWSAALMLPFGATDILSLRNSVAVFQLIALYAGIVTCAQLLGRRTLGGMMFITLCAGVIVLWMFPRHKLFDASISILLIAILSRVVTSPNKRNWFFVGCMVGIAAIFGRNHGVYGTFGSMVTLACLCIRQRDHRSLVRFFVAWAMGVAVGYSPMIAVALFATGFAGSFVESVKFILSREHTNIPLPIPWPWSVDVVALPPAVAARAIMIGIMFVAILVFALASTAVLAYSAVRRRAIAPPVAAAAALSIPYAHFAVSRADLGHLAQGIFPMMIGALALCCTNRMRPRLWGATTLFIASAWVMLPAHPGYQLRDGPGTVATEVSGKQLFVTEHEASDIAFLNRLSGDRLGNGCSLYITPYWPGAYALLGMRSPVWEIFALFPRPREFECEEIGRLAHERPCMAVVIDLPLDGREEMRFSRTHPLTYEYLTLNFDPDSELSTKTIRVFRARSRP